MPTLSKELYTQYKRPERKLKTEWGESLTEQAGYISAEEQIYRLIQAGERLMSYRKEQYDFEAGENIDMNIEIPIRDPNFDMADASEIKLNLENKEKSKKKEEKLLTEKKKDDIISQEVKKDDEGNENKKIHNP